MISEENHHESFVYRADSFSRGVNMLKCALFSLLVCVCLAQTPIPPQVKFVNGLFTGTLQTQGLNVPLTGTLEYLPGSTQMFKTHVVANANGNMITSDTWETITSTVINSWEIVSTDPTTCNAQTLSGSTYPSCNAWSNMGPSWSLECQVSIQGVEAVVDIIAIVNSANQLVQYQENTTVSGQLLTTEVITINSQTTNPPPSGDFTLPSICSNAYPVPIVASPRLRVKHQPKIFHAVAGAIGGLFSARRLPFRRN